jgi:hypothetical protein
LLLGRRADDLAAFEAEAFSADSSTPGDAAPARTAKRLRLAPED